MNATRDKPRRFSHRARERLQKMQRKTTVVFFGFALAFFLAVIGLGFAFLWMIYRAF
jgi:hypothetical protein